MKTNMMLLGIITIFVLGITSCKKDDDAPDYEVLEENIFIKGQATLMNLNKKIIVNLSDGNLLEETMLSNDKNIKKDKEDIYEFSATSIKKINGAGTIDWVKEYPSEANRLNKLEEANTVFSENILYVSYKILDTNTYASDYYLEALDLENGNTNWKVNVGATTFPYLYKNRLITVQYPNGNSPTVFQYRNKVHGQVEVENTIDERINDYIFDGDLIIANSWSNKVFALDRSLHTVWSFNTDEENPGTGYINENQYLFFSRDQHIYSIDKNSGTLNWKTFMPERLALGIHQHDKYVYLGQQTGTKTLTLSKINNENGEVESTMETSMSEDYYTTQLTFHKEYLLLITSPTSNERASEIEARLYHLPNSQEIWSNHFNMDMVDLHADLELD